jgi:hypothetical protein
MSLQQLYDQCSLILKKAAIHVNQGINITLITHSSFAG